MEVPQTGRGTKEQPFIKTAWMDIHVKRVLSTIVSQAWLVMHGGPRTGLDRDGSMDLEFFFGTQRSHMRGDMRWCRLKMRAIDAAMKVFLMMRHGLKTGIRRYGETCAGCMLGNARGPPVDAGMPPLPRDALKVWARLAAWHGGREADDEEWAGLIALAQPIYDWISDLNARFALNGGFIIVPLPSVLAGQAIGARLTMEGVDDRPDRRLKAPKSAPINEEKYVDPLDADEEDE